MIDVTKRVEFEDVEVIDDLGLLLRCRVNGRTLGIPPLRLLPGTQVHRTGDRGKLVLPRDVAEDLGLIPPPRA
jgi:hypothetical protein